MLGILGAGLGNNAMLLQLAYYKTAPVLVEFVWTLLQVTSYRTPMSFINPINAVPSVLPKIRIKSKASL
jgi:hypothetical protein